MESIKTVDEAVAVEVKEKIGFFTARVRPRIWEFFWFALGAQLSANTGLAYLSGNFDEAFAWGICAVWVFNLCISNDMHDRLIKAYRWALDSEGSLIENMLKTLNRQQEVLKEQQETNDGMVKAMTSLEKERDMYKMQYEALSVVKDVKKELKVRKNVKK